jgi:hypothetical protein
LFDAEVVAVFAGDGCGVGVGLVEGFGVGFPLLMVLFVADEGDAFDGGGAVDFELEDGWAGKGDFGAEEFVVAGEFDEDFVCGGDGAAGVEAFDDAFPGEVFDVDAAVAGVGADMVAVGPDAEFVPEF